MIICPNCNHQNPDGAVQCEACYTPLPQKTACPTCGATVQSDASFCGQCGADLRGAASAVEPVNPTSNDINIPDLLPPDPLVVPEPITPQPAASEPRAAQPPMAESPLSEMSLGETPLAEFPLSEVPMAELSLDEVPLSEVPVSEALENEISFNETPMNPVPLAEISVGEPSVRNGSTAPTTKTGVEPLGELAAEPLGELAAESLGDVQTAAVITTPQTRLQRNMARLLHVQTDAVIELAPTLSVIRLGKPNDRVPPDIDISGFPDSEIVSRTHANIRVEGDVYYIEDVGSSNGTYINNLPLPQGNRHRLRPGDRIALGKGDKVSFIFQLA